MSGTRRFVIGTAEGREKGRMLVEPTEEGLTHTKRLQNLISHHFR